MPIKTVLAPMTGGATCRTAAIAAARVARDFEAQLIGLYVRSDPAAVMPYAADGLTADVVDDLIASVERATAERAREARRSFEAIAAECRLGLEQGPPSADGPSAKWLERAGLLGETIGRQARVADLTVLPQPNAKADPMSAGLIGDVLTRSGRALLMVPDGPRAVIGARVLVAWNGSSEAARALADALPFLTRAPQVAVATLGDIYADRPDSAAAADYLRAHGVAPQLIEAARNAGGIGPQLLELATQYEADLLVVGAYSHHRWREMMLGGVTRALIEKASLPVLMSH